MYRTHVNQFVDIINQAKFNYVFCPQHIDLEQEGYNSTLNADNPCCMDNNDFVAS